MSDELKERNTLKLILIVRFACGTLDVDTLYLGPFIHVPAKIVLDPSPSRQSNILHVSSI
jgi:hypothetical protein